MALSHYHLKDYNSFTKSSNLFLNRYENFFFDLPHYTKEEALAMIFCMKAKVFLDFGKYKKAQIVIQKAEKQITNFDFRDTYQYYFKNIIEVFGTAGLVHALSGNCAEGEKYKKKIEGLSFYSVLDKPLSKKMSFSNNINRINLEFSRMTNQSALLKQTWEVFDNAYYDDKITAIAKIYVCVHGIY